MVNTKTVVLDGERYDLTHLSPTKAWSTLTRLLRIVGGPIGSGIDVKDIRDLKKIDIKFDELLRNLSNNLDTPEAEQVIYSLLGATSHKGQYLKDEYLEIHFMGKVGTMFAVVLEQVKFQYEDFFQKIAGLMSAVVPAQRSGSPLRPTSSGSSGESSSPAKRPSTK